jgi:hypothetical protein
MGVMADSEELLRALTALVAIRMPTGREQDQAQRAAGGPVLWRVQCAHHLAGAVECQVLMAAGAVPAVKEKRHAAAARRVGAVHGRRHR